MEWVAGRLDDDIALVLMEYAGRAAGQGRTRVGKFENRIRQ